MSARPEPLNAIAYAQYHLRGGWKGLAGIALLAAVCVGGISAVALGSAPTTSSYADAARQLVYVCAGLQWLLLCIAGFARVAAATRQDVVSGMIESHRLSPTSPLAAAFGYVAGGGLQILAPAAIIFVAGLVLSVIAQMPLLGWMLNSAMALTTAFMLWSLAALFSFGVGLGGATPALIAIGSATFSVAGAVPAIAVLGVPLIGRSLWTSAAQGTVPPVYAFAVVGDVLLAGVFLLAAARRYRSSATAAFSIRIAIVLLVVWSALNVIGFALPDFSSRMASADAPFGAKMMAAVMSSTLIAFIPVGAIARYSVTPPEMYAPGTAPARPALAWLLLVPCIALACAPTLMAADGFDPSSLPFRWLGTLAVVSVLLAQVGLLIGWEDLNGRVGLAVLFVWLAITNLLPVLAQIIADPNHTLDTPGIGKIAAVSPVYALVLLWGRSPDLALNGIACQAGLTAVPLILFVIRLRSANRNAPKLTFDPPAAK